MGVDIVELYGPGMSFYRSKTNDKKAGTTTTVEERGRRPSRFVEETPQIQRPLSIQRGVVVVY